MESSGGVGLDGERTRGKIQRAKKLDHWSTSQPGCWLLVVSTISSLATPSTSNILHPGTISSPTDLDIAVRGTHVQQRVHGIDRNVCLHASSMTPAGQRLSPMHLQWLRRRSPERAHRDPPGHAHGRNMLGHKTRYVRLPWIARSVAGSIVHLCCRRGAMFIFGCKLYIQVGV